MLEVIILAAGKGTRMKDTLPKALIKLKGKPMISYGIEAAKQAGFTDPIIVISDQKQIFQKELGEHCFVIQKETLGTGYAVKLALNAIKPNTERVIVFYCDNPLISTETIKSLADSKGTIVLGTSLVEDFNDWRSVFYGFGRIIRDKEENITDIVERKDASPEQLLIKEVNPSYFCFDRSWLQDAIHKISNDNAQKEYYLTDLIKQAYKDKKKIVSIAIPVEEALGANTKEELAILEKFIEK